MAIDDMPQLDHPKSHLTPSIDGYLAAAEGAKQHILGLVQSLVVLKCCLGVGFAGPDGISSFA
jgi:hypothetical protein